MKIYWGDLHCHCAVSYGNATPRRSLDNARQHLDFCSITGHAFWPDIPMHLSNKERIIGEHLGGFAKLQYFWNDLMCELRRANAKDRFVAFPSYEWHSRKFGDYNCYFNGYDTQLVDAPNPKALARKLKRRKYDFMLFPHHCGYIRGHRGLNWDAFNSTISPIIEIYSNHGSAESDDSPYEYHHSMGPRVGESMIREGLLAGHRFGFCASTDNHDGYPGHYGHGRVGAVASRLDRNSIWQALRERRTIASTGARIAANVRLDGATIGQITPLKEKMALKINVEGTAPIEKVELLESAGKRWRLRRLPIGCLQTDFKSGRYKIKIEVGWGMNIQVSNWHIKARLKYGKLLGCEPCFRFSVLCMAEQESSERILKCNRNQVEWTCRAAPNPAGMMGGTHFNSGGTQAMVLDIEAGRESCLEISTGDVNFDLKISKLAKCSVGKHVAGYGFPAIKIHRAVPEQEFIYSYVEPYVPVTERPGFVYLRISQSDGQVAWVSPIWFE